jgi:heptosyltransferase-2
MTLLCKPIQRLLVIRLGALGDLVHLSAALHALHEHQSEVKIHLLSRNSYAPLVAMIPGVTQFWAWPEKPTLRNLLALGRTLKAAGIDGLVNLQPSLKTFFLTAIVGKPVATYHKQKCRVFGVAQRHLPRLHAVEDFYQPFRKLLPQLPATPTLVPWLQSQSSLEDRAGKIEHSRCIGIIPGVGGKRANRAWPREHWIEFLKALAKKTTDLRILLIGGQEEKALAQEIVEALLSPIDINTLKLENHCGRWDIPGTTRLMMQCELLIGGDTGPLHLAASLNVPVLGLYGPTAVARTGPRGCAMAVTLTPPETVLSWPCEKPSCLAHSEDPQACIRPLAIETVLEAVWGMLAKKA